MSCSRMQHGDTCGDRTLDLSIRSLTLDFQRFMLLIFFASEKWISTEQEVVRSHGILMTSEDQHDITPDHVICTVSHVT